MMMRRAALLCLTLALTGCGSGFGDFIGDTATIRRNVNSPISDSLTTRRVRELPVEVPALQTEPGDVWPGPVQPEPTLQDLQDQARHAPPETTPMPAPGSSTPPGSNVPGMAPLPTPGVSRPPVAVAPARPFSPPAIQTQRGPAVNAGPVGRNMQNYTAPGNPNAGGIMIPNGNGTSTLVHPDGSVETVPTAR
jgi:hypothetical protein